MSTENTGKMAAVASIGFPAAGELTVVGLGVYTMLGAFYDTGDPLKGIGFSSTGVGNIIDVSESELAGDFHVNPNDYVGACEYSLDEIDVEAGVMRLTLWSANGSVKIATLDGPAEGFGEAVTKKKKGSLYILPKGDNNLVSFSGDKTIKTIAFDLTAQIVSQGGKFSGVQYAQQNGNTNELSIDFQAKSDESTACATWFNESVGNKEAHMIHTEHGDNMPKVLYFAFQGVLTINGDAFNICLGQGEYVWAGRNWHLASMELDADKNGKNGNLGKYRLEQDGSNTFKVKVK